MHDVHFGRTKTTLAWYNLGWPNDSSRVACWINDFLWGSRYRNTPEQSYKYRCVSGWWVERVRKYFRSMHRLTALSFAAHIFPGMRLSPISNLLRSFDYRESLARTTFRSLQSTPCKFNLSPVAAACTGFVFFFFLFFVYNIRRRSVSPTSDLGQANFRRTGVSTSNPHVAALCNSRVWPQQSVRLAHRWRVKDSNFFW